MRETKLLLVHGYELFRQGLEKLLQSESHVTIKTMVCTVSEVVETATVYKPDVVLIDIEWSESVETILRLRQIVPDVRIIALTHSKISTNLFSALNAGATGYISKDISCENLLKTIDLVNEGQLVIGDHVVTLVVGALKFLYEHRHTAQPSYVSLLGEQEKAILRLMAQDATNKEIASTLHISESTVKVHVHNILAKLQARNRLEASISAVEEGLVYNVLGADIKQV